MNKKNTLYYELERLVKENPKNYVTVLKSTGFQDRCQNRQHLRNYVIAMTPLLIDTPSFKYKWKTRVYWVLNGIENWNDIRVKCMVCGNPFVNIDVKNITYGYSKKTCCKICERKLASMSCIKHMQDVYGVDNAFQVKEVIDKLKALKLAINEDDCHSCFGSHQNIPASSKSFD